MLPIEQDKKRSENFLETLEQQRYQQKFMSRVWHSAVNPHTTCLVCGSPHVNTYTDELPLCTLHEVYT